jgi:hypothetical protein
MVGDLRRDFLASALRRWPLLAVVLLEIALFAGHGYEWWKHRAGPAHPETLQGEGLVIRGDGLGYYAWLRSLLIDGDWSFDNEFDEHNPFKDGLTGPSARTDLGLRVNPWSVGPALAWAPAVTATHFLLRLPGPWRKWPADGYTLPYQLAVGLTTLGLSVLGLLFLYGICRRYAGPRRAAWAAALLTLGTAIVYYNAVEVSMAHGIGTVALAGLVWFWLRTYGSTRWRRWLLLGVLIGLAGLVRWQLATFALLPTGECILSCRRAWLDRAGRVAVRQIAGLFLAGAASLVVFLPQLVAWRSVFGHWLVTPQAVCHNWTRPALWSVLLSQDRSLFYWTPITLLACLGFLTYFPRWCRSSPEAALGDKVTEQTPCPLVPLSPCHSATYAAENCHNGQYPR